ncbi:MAG: tetratricopeptide repeat protein, partial [Phycisphaerae bacterium]|nr:tetratricopeptide repeat protein [Phycisphaerae bacterium]
AAGAAPTGLFGKAAPSSSLGYDPSVVVRQAVRLRELTLAHRHDPLYGEAPLREFLSLNRRHPFYPLNLVRLLLDYPGARIEPVCAVRLARRETSPRALVERLQRLATEYAAAPARAEILFALGRAREDQGRLSEARQAFETLLELHADSSFAADARERLIMLTMLEISRPAGGGRP